MIITISRESGCGGHEIGLRVAKKLNIPFYDKKYFRELAELNGIDTNMPEFRDDLSGGIRSYVENNIKGRKIISSLIKDTVNQESCVIVGRCADHIINEECENLVSFFIHADCDIKIARMMERKHLSPIEAQKRIKHIDAERKVYYERFAGRNWKEIGSYNFSLDSGYLGLNGCVDAIIFLAENKLKIFKCFD